MSDPVFEKFRRKLADAVTIVINSGERVSASNARCLCPLGCLPEEKERRPCYLFGPFAEFTAGFDAVGSAGLFPEYKALGRLYRSRFP